MKHVTLSPELKKWGTFGALVVTLGFSLSWNPQQPFIARNELGVVSTELASATDDNRAEIDMGTVSDQYKGIKAKVTYLEKDKQFVVVTSRVDSEGKSIETCDACTKARISNDKEYSLKNENDLLSIAYKIANDPKLKEFANKKKEDDKKSDSKDKVASEDLCEDKVGDSELTCRMEVYTSAVTACKDSKLVTSKKKLKEGEKSCDQKLTDAFAPIEKAMKKCSSTRKLRIDDDLDLDCDSLKDFAQDEVLSESPSSGHIRKTLRFLGAGLNAQLSADQARLRQAGAQPTQIEQQMAFELENLVGASAIQQMVYNPATGQYQKQYTVVPARGASNAFYSALQGNDRFKTSQAVDSFFNDNFFKNYSALRLNDLNNPAGNILATYNFDALSNSIGVPSNLAEYRGSQVRGTTTIPALPVMANVGTQNGLPYQQGQQFNRNGTTVFQPTTTTLPNSGTLLSPAQRQQLPQNQVFRQ